MFVQGQLKIGELYFLCSKLFRHCDRCWSPKKAISHRIHVCYIYGNIDHQYTPNVSIYTIHGSYGYWSLFFLDLPMSHPVPCRRTKRRRWRRWWKTRGRRSRRRRKRPRRRRNGGKLGFFLPRCSMYGIFTYIWVIFEVNVGKYSIHGASGLDFLPDCRNILICRECPWFIFDIFVHICPEPFAHCFKRFHQPSIPQSISHLPVSMNQHKSTKFINL